MSPAENFYSGSISTCIHTQNQNLNLVGKKHEAELVEMCYLATSEVIINSWLERVNGPVSLLAECANNYTLQ